MYSSFNDNIWGADFADMQLISKYNKGICLLFCVIDIFSKYAWVIPLKHRKGIRITDAFQKNLTKSSRKQNKILGGKGSEFYNRSIKSWLQGSDMEMYSTHNEIKSVFAETFFRTLKNKI